MSSTPRGPARLEMGVLVLLKGEKNQYLVPFLINTKLAQLCTLWWTMLRSLVSLGFRSPSLVLQHICCVVRQRGAACVEPEGPGGPVSLRCTLSTLSSPRGTLPEADISYRHVATTLHDMEKISVTCLIALQTFMNTATNSLGKWKINFYTTWQQAVD